MHESLLELFDHGMSIDPAHRFTSARDLAAAFEQLTRRYLELSEFPEPQPSVPPTPEMQDQAVEVLKQHLANADHRMHSMSREIEDLHRERAELKAYIETQSDALQKWAAHTEASQQLQQQQLPSFLQQKWPYILVLGVMSLNVLALAAIAGVLFTALAANP